MEQQKDNYQKGPTNTSRTFQGHDATNTEHRVGAPTQFSSNTSRPSMAGSLNLEKNPAQPVSNSAQSSSPRGLSNPQGFYYVVRKAEKLTTALYLVTDIMSEKEPLKWKAREIGVDLLSDITIASSLSTSEKMSMLRDIMKKAEKVIAFLDVAQSAHLMSDMNSSMLKKEYVALKDNIEGEWERVYEASKSIFSESFFDVPRSAPKEPDTLSGTAHTLAIPKETEEAKRREDLSCSSETTKSSLMGAFSAHDSPTPQPTHSGATPPTISHISPRQMTKKVENVNATTSSSRSQMVERTFDTQPAVLNNTPMGRLALSSVSGVAMFPYARTQRSDGDRDDRRKIILALIKHKPALTVRDITKSIPQVSEKTIQRELLAMVSEGTLLKRGERRWSTYSLRQQ